MKTCRGIFVARRSVRLLLIEVKYGWQRVERRSYVTGRTVTAPPLGHKGMIMAKLCFSIEYVSTDLVALRSSRRPKG